MSFKRRVLGALSKPELLEVGRALELPVKTAMTVDELRELVAASKGAKLAKFVTTELERDTLKAICEAVGLDATGREKAALVERILAAAERGKAGGQVGSQGGAEPPPSPPAVAAKLAPQAGLPLPAASEAEVKAARDSIAPTAQAKKPKASATPPDTSPVVSYRHRDQRKNNPDVGTVGATTDPEQPRTRWAYDPHLDPALQFDVGRGQVESVIDGALESGEPAAMKAALEQLRRQAAPYLAWSGKAERTSFEVDTVSLHVHERIDPSSILASARKGAAKAEARAAEAAAAGKPGRASSVHEAHHQYGLFGDPFENLPLREALDYYKHDRGWANRLVAGDSLLVMNSLLQKEGLAGRVQMIYLDPPYGIRYGSNFQPFVNRRDVKDGKDEDLTQEPEMIKAFRDTWELGIHSYLTYLRDRLLLAKELLTESGSIFVQISDENVHLVRNLMDEVFGVENFCSLITVKKTGGQTSELLPRVADYLLWYCRLRSGIKYRVPLQAKVVGEGDGTGLRYDQIEEPGGRRRRATREELEGRAATAASRQFRLTSLISSGFRPNTTVEFQFRGRSYHPGTNANWKTHLSGLARLGKCNRIAERIRTLEYVRMFEDFPAVQRTSIWDDLAGATAPIYVVQTNEQIIQRCLLMTTDPGDLVLDPTCGSGTTAVVAEKWGRRWITCDTSRVAITLAKQRLATSSFDYFDLKYPHEGLKGGFVYKTVPHIMLSSIANNPEIDEIYERDHPAIEAALAALNAALAGLPVTFEIDEGGRAGTTLDFSRKGTALLEWEVPFDFPDAETAGAALWPAAARAPFEAFHAARQAMQRAMDASIAAHADQETLYDQPRIDKTKRRVAGPFTVEAVPFPTVAGLDEAAPPAEADTAIARSGETSRQHQWRDELLKTGVRGKGGQILRLASLEPLPGTRFLHGVGTVADSGDRVVVSFGPEHGALEQRQVETALREAGKLFPLPSMIIFCAFVFDPEAAKDIDETRGITALKAQMNTDLLTEDLKKARASNQSFWLMGQPDVELVAKPGGLFQVSVHGFDYFDPAKGELTSGGKGKIAMWLLDPDYDERSLLPTQVFFPLAGAKDGWHRLRKDLRAELDESRLAAFHGTTSLPFAPGVHRKVAVKLIDDRGIESLKILPLPDSAAEA
jgi:adenine-specific DNA-methyltransferase